MMIYAPKVMAPILCWSLLSEVQFDGTSEVQFGGMSGEQFGGMPELEFGGMAGQFFLSISIKWTL